MVKTLNEINREFAAQYINARPDAKPPETGQGQEGGPRGGRTISGLINAAAKDEASRKPKIKPLAGDPDEPSESDKAWQRFSSLLMEPQASFFDTDEADPEERPGRWIEPLAEMMKSEAPTIEMRGKAPDKRVLWSGGEKQHARQAKKKPADRPAPPPQTLAKAEYPGENGWEYRPAERRPSQTLPDDSPPDAKPKDETRVKTVKPLKEKKRFERPAPAKKDKDEKAPEWQERERRSREEGPKVKRKHSVFSIVSNTIFYTALAILALVAVVFVTNGNKDARTILGLTYYSVISTSMQSEIPLGSVVVSEKTDTSALKVKDDITFLKSDGSIVTHRIVTVMDNYEDSGSRAFVTKGIENPEPDREIVSAENVIGKVKMVIPNAGFLLSYIADNLAIVLVLFGIMIVLSIALGILFDDRRKTKIERRSLA